MQQINANFYIDTTYSTPPLGPGCNVAFVVTSEGIVMIDSPMLPRNAFRWREEIAKRGQVRYLINTEYHPDHVSGNYFFPTTVVSHQGVREQFSAPVDVVMNPEDQNMNLREYIIKQYQMLDPENLPKIGNYQPRPPTITFSDKLTLYSGNYNFELMHLPGHTASNIGVCIPQERIVFVGDNFVNKWRDTLETGYPLEWIESLKKIEALDVDYIVPGHGEIADKKQFRKFIDYIQEVIDMVRRAISQGMGQDEAVEKISFEGMWGPEIHPGGYFQSRSVKRFYQMLSK
jgi:cyclase